MNPLADASASMPWESHLRWYDPRDGYRRQFQKKGGKEGKGDREARHHTPMPASHARHMMDSTGNEKAVRQASISRALQARLPRMARLRKKEFKTKAKFTLSLHVDTFQIFAVVYPVTSVSARIVKTLMCWNLG